MNAALFVSVSVQSLCTCGTTRFPLSVSEVAVIVVADSVVIVLAPVTFNVPPKETFPVVDNVLPLSDPLTLRLVRLAMPTLEKSNESPLGISFSLLPSFVSTTSGNLFAIL